jgi:hypothetical protein
VGWQLLKALRHSRHDICPAKRLLECLCLPDDAGLDVCVLVAKGQTGATIQQQRAHPHPRLLRHYL